jgi:hypothetical protein
VRITDKKKCQTIQTFFPKKNSKEENAVAIAEAASVVHSVKHGLGYNSLDCQNELAPRLFDGKVASQISCGRTKATAIAENVLAPFSESRLTDELKLVPFYSLSSDASNVGDKKTFPNAVKYFSRQKGICGCI